MSAAPPSSKRRPSRWWYLQLVLAEATYFVGKLLGSVAEADFLRELAGASLELYPGQDPVDSYHLSGLCGLGCIITKEAENWGGPALGAVFAGAVP